MAEGFLPMARQVVRLSTDAETARQVGLRHRGRLAILAVDATGASHDGIRFYQDNKNTWPAGAVPADYLRPLDQAREPYQTRKARNVHTMCSAYVRLFYF